MIFVYRLLFFLVSPILILRNLPKIFKRGGYGKNFKHRLGLFPFLPKSQKKRLWIQAVSVGEVNAIIHLISLLSRKYEIVLTTTTPTACKIIEEKVSKNILFHGYFPWDFWLFSWIAWRQIQADAIILVDSELWPEHLTRAKRQKIPIFLINARLSDHSFYWYQKFPLFARWIFKKLDFIITSSEDNREKIATFYNKTIEYFGNLKFDISVALLSPKERKTLKIELGFAEDAFVIIGCSTWLGEEALLLKAFREICNNNETKHSFALLLVPRHAERRHELVEWLGNEKVSFWQRSKGIANKSFNICLADTTGELPQLIQVADLAYIGKSLAPHKGGQSPLDAAMAEIPIIYGNRMTNFRDICEQLEQKNAAIKVTNEKEAIEQLMALSFNTQKRIILTNNIGNWFKHNQGISEKIYHFIQNKLGY
ncbi:MAG: hypothetical protein LBS71_01455 [Puniceicoccales bacterium]|nr:hypothetical protein [Puniceicoccales bacterium]